MSKDMLSKIKLFPVIAGLIIFAAASGVNNAVPNSGMVTTSLIVPGICSVGNAAMNFGSYDPVSKNAVNSLDTSSSFTIACTKGVSAAISLNTGNNGGRSALGTRSMSSGGASADYIGYDLFTSNSYTTVWNSTNVVNYVANNKNTRVIRVFGRIPPGQDVGAGFYTDTVTIVANF
jgi:spore coat protein U-like protein